MIILSAKEWHDVKEFAKNNSYLEALEKLNKVSEFDKDNFKIIILGCCQKGMRAEAFEKIEKNITRIDEDLLEILLNDYPYKKLIKVPRHYEDWQKIIDDFSHHKNIYRGTQPTSPLL